MSELVNCPQCNKVFVKTVRNICPDCYRKEEEAFRKVHRFLSKRENREATILEIVEATGVEEELIIKFIREKRLLTSRFPKLTYPCEKCGTEIVTGKLCKQCSEDILHEFKQHEKLEERKHEYRKNSNRIDTYYSIDKKES